MEEQEICDSTYDWGRRVRITNKKLRSGKI